MKWNSKLVLLLCPPLLLGCGGGDGPVRGGSSKTASGASRTVSARPLPALEVASVPPARGAILLEGDLQLRLDTVAVAEGDSLLAGDTLAAGVDTLSLLEAQRVRMEADFLRHSPEGDSLRLDSLLALAAELESPRPLLAGRSGTVSEVHIRPGQHLSPGDTMALVVRGEASVRLRLPPGASLQLWPRLEGVTPVETTDSTAVYSVAPTGRDSIRLDSLWRVPRNALRDEGLRSFVLLPDGDTVSVRRMGSCSGDVVVYGPLEGRELQTW